MKKIILIGLLSVALLTIFFLGCNEATTVGGTVVTFNSSVADSFSDATIDKIVTIHYDCYLQGSSTPTVFGDHSVTVEERTDYKNNGTVKISVQIDKGTYSVLVSARDVSGTPICNWLKTTADPLVITESKTVDVVLDGPYGPLGLSWD